MLNIIAADNLVMQGSRASAAMALTYRKTPCISRTKSQNLNISRLVLQFSLPNPLKPGVKSIMKM